MQLFCATACFLFTSGTPLQASKLTFGSDSDACYAAFLRSLTETFRGLNSCTCALTSNLLKAAVLHYFPSRIGAVLVMFHFLVHFREAGVSWLVAGWYLFAPGTQPTARKGNGG